MEEEKIVRNRKETEQTDDTGWKPGLGQLLGIVFILLLLLGAIIAGVSTGMGLVVAVPLVVVAIVAAFLVFRGGATPRSRNSRCPYCGALVTTATHIAEINCPSCNRRVEFRKGVILRAE